MQKSMRVLGLSAYDVHCCYGLSAICAPAGSIGLRRCLLTENFKIYWCLSDPSSVVLKIASLAMKHTAISTNNCYLLMRYKNHLLPLLLGKAMIFIFLLPNPSFLSGSVLNLRKGMGQKCPCVRIRDLPGKLAWWCCHLCSLLTNPPGMQTRSMMPRGNSPLMLLESSKEKLGRRCMPLPLP